MRRPTHDLAKALRDALGGVDEDELTKQLRRALEGKGQATTQRTTTSSWPSYGLNSTALISDLASRLGPGTTVDIDLNH